MNKKGTVLTALALIVAGMLFPGCDDADDSARQAARAEQRLAEARSELARSEAELAGARQALAASEQRADSLARELARERIETRGAREELEAHRGDFYASMAVAFSAVVAALLILQLLLKERRARLAMAGLLRWLKRRKDT